MEILSLGEKIKRRRKELNMTLKDRAKDRITPGQISLVESGRSNPSMDLLEYLANSLNTTVEYLMESEESQAEKICTYYEQVAESYILSGDYVTGEKYIENALYYAERYNLEYRKARILFLRAEIHISKGELAVAQQFFLSSNVIFIKNNEYEEIVRTFLKLGKITLELNAYHSANSYLKQAEKVYLDNNIGNDFLLGEIYYNMSRTYYIIEDLGQAMDYAFLAKEKFDQIHNKKEYAKTLLLLSEEYNRRGDLNNAIKYSTKTLEVYHEINDLKSVSDIENNLGKLFYNFENIEESFKHYEMAREIKTRNNDDSLIETLINICKNYLKIKEIDKCEMQLEEIYHRLKDDDIDGRIECNLIKYRVHTIKDELSEAEDVLVNTYKLSKNTDKLRRAGELAIMVGKFYIDHKNDTQAAKYLDEGVSIFKELGILQN